MLLDSELQMFLDVNNFGVKISSYDYNLSTSLNANIVSKLYVIKIITHIFMEMVNIFPNFSVDVCIS